MSLSNIQFTYLTREKYNEEITSHLLAMKVYSLPDPSQ